MFCGKCGATIAGDNKFCTQCGAPVGAAAAAPTATAAPAPAAAPTPQPAVATAPHAKAKPFTAAWFTEPMKYGTFTIPRFIVLIASIAVIIIGIMAMGDGIRELTGGGNSENYNYPDQSTPSKP